METRVNKKITFYVNDLKDGVVNQINMIKDSTMDVETQYETLISYIMNYKVLNLQKEDFNKRKRNKNVVNECEKCKAKRSNGEQCSRRRRDGFEFCGTHCKGTPYGIIGVDDLSSSAVKIKYELVGEDIDGIITYRDKNNREYKIEHII